MDKKKRTILSLLITILPLVMLVPIARAEGRARSLLTLAMFLIMGIGSLALNHFGKKREEEAPSEEMPDEDLPELFRSGDCMTVMDGFSGAIYSIVRDSQKYLFMKIGGEVRGLTVENLPQPKMYSEAALNEMGIKHFFLRREELTGYKYDEKPSVSTNWSNSGSLTFLGKKKKKYIILDKVEPRQVHSFMSGVPNVTSERVTARNARTRETQNREKRWLDKNQNPEQMKKMKTIGLVLSVCSYVLAGVFLFIAEPYKLLSVACMVGCVICIVLALKFPAYFSLVEAKKDAAKRGHKPREFLMMPLLILMAALMMRTFLDFSFTSWTGLLIGGGLITAAVAVLLWQFALEFRERKADFVATVFMILFMSLGVVGQLNYLLDVSEPQIYYTEVVDHHISSGKSTSYYCTVILENGEEFDIQVGRDMYQRIDVGDWVKTVTHSGGLGIEYVGISQ